MTKVLITTSSYGKFDSEPLDILTAAGCDVTLNPHKRKLTEDEATELISDFDYLIAGTEPLTARVLDSAQQLKGISRCGVGMDNVDQTVCEQKGIQVGNTPGGPTMAVAELSLGMMLSLLRHISQMDQELKSGTWNKQMGNLLSQKTVGLIGFGSIGRAVSRLLAPFDVTVLVYDPYVDSTADLAAYERLVSLEDLLKASDIISCHSSATTEIIRADLVTQIKPGAYFVNTSRASAMRESVLIDALKNGTLAGAALDVFETEPYQGPLADLPNVIMTPHVGSYAKEARIQQELRASQNVLDWLA